MRERRRRPLGVWASTGLAVGALTGLVAGLPLHDYLFGLPTNLFPDATTAILAWTSSWRLPVGREAAILVAHAGIGGLAGLLAGSVAELAPRGSRLRARLSHPGPVGLAVAVAGTALLTVLWSRREIVGSVLPLTLILGVLVVWNVVVAALLSALGARLARTPLLAGLLVLAGLGAALAASLAAPRLEEVTGAEDSPGPGRPLLLVGLDAASWANLDAPLEAGRLPHLRRLREAGAWGQLESLPITLSPVVWTTVATGRRPAEHGIRDFAVDGVPYTSNSRTSWALWEVLPLFERRTAFLWWWASWPAESVDGLVVTDRLLDRGLERRVHPPEAVAKLDALVDATRSALPGRHVLLGPGGEALPGDFARRHRRKLAVLDEFLERDEIVTAIGVDALESRAYDLVAVYLRSPDAAGHKFWKWHYWRTSPGLAAWVYGPQDRDQEIFAPVVDRVHERADDQLGRLLEAAGPDTNIVVVSDHGMTASIRLDARPGSEPETGNHHRSGLLLLAGPDIHSGVEVRGASVYDVFPTLLHLLGLPVPEDLAGRVLAEVLTEEALRSRPLRRIAGFGTRPTRPTQPIATESDSDYLERLRALGYVVP